MAVSRTHDGRSTRLAVIARPGVPAAEAADHVPEASLASAAEAVRQAEIDAAERLPPPPPLSWAELGRLNIDQLRAVAGELDVPNLGEIVDRYELIAEIRRRM
jgi:hypothetical protein